MQAISQSSIRRHPVFQPRVADRLVVDVEGVEALIPHRSPMRLVDGLDAFSMEPLAVSGHLHVAADDPVFRGHFPGDPVYPGVFLVEAMGQVGLCAFGLHDAGGELPGPDARPPAVRVIKVHHAVFLAPVGPGQDLTILAALSESNGITGVIAGQVWRGETLCAASFTEVYFV